ncbi:hypothetical protein [Fibrisoma montanum]|nr:hypothetical protein [Fibrisoma montanum]
MEVEDGSIIYAFFTALLAIGFFIGEYYTLSKLEIHKSLSPTLKIDRPFIFILLIFPVLWLISFVKSLGFLPVLAGVDITDDMYGMSYGPLYGYSIINSISIVLVYSMLIRSDKMYIKILCILYIVMIMAISSVDSKRYVLLISLLSMFVFNKVWKRSFRFDFFILVYALVGAILYIALLGLRQGNLDANDYNQYFENLAIGVEYRDFIRTFNDFEPGKIPHYNFERSLIGAFLNVDILNFFGYDKKELTLQGSAYTWMTIFNSSLGIRTGLISELYFAYDLIGGGACILLFGLLVNYVSFKIHKAISELQLVLLCIVYSLLLLSVMGQSTATVGQLCILMYVYFAYSFYKRFSRNGKINPTIINLQNKAHTV